MYRHSLGESLKITTVRGIRGGGLTPGVACWVGQLFSTLEGTSMFLNLHIKEKILAYIPWVQAALDEEKA